MKVDDSKSVLMGHKLVVNDASAALNEAIGTDFCRWLLEVGPAASWGTC